METYNSINKYPSISKDDQDLIIRMANELCVLWKEPMDGDQVLDVSRCFVEALCEINGETDQVYYILRSIKKTNYVI